MGSAAKPSEKLLAGAEGQKQLVAVKEEGRKGLSAYFEASKGKGVGVLGEGGLPPMPVPARNVGAIAQGYKIDEDQSYKDQYPCRNFV